VVAGKAGPPLVVNSGAADSTGIGPASARRFSARDLDEFGALDFRHFGYVAYPKLIKTWQIALCHITRRVSVCDLDEFGANSTHNSSRSPDSCRQKRR
jgi:hypothetical protein